MTDIGKAFADIAETVNRLHGFGSKKMTAGYTVYECDGYEVSEYDIEKADLLEQLVRMGYLRKFTTEPFLNNRKKILRFMVRNVCFGLTAKGWEVAPKYIAILENQNAIATAELKAKNYFEKVKETNPITYEEALELAIKGVL
jgi:hypothetical protein